MLEDWMSQYIGEPSCVKCKNLLTLVIQVYCPLDTSQYHRTIYVFCCTYTDCWTSSKSWCIYRMQCQQLKQKPKEKKMYKKVFDSWGDDDDNWDDAEDPYQLSFSESAIEFNEMEAQTQCSANDNDVEKSTDKLEMLQLNNQPSSPTIVCVGSNQIFDSHYINVFNETDYEPTTFDDTQHINDLISKYSNLIENEGSSACFNICQDVEAYEKDVVEEKLFYKFWKKVQRCPLQVIRYSLNGFPLLFSAPPSNSSISPCSYCGAERRFEFQLMPALIPYLRVKMKDFEHIEFGTVLIYTCSKSCWISEDGAPREELAIYYPDPDLKYFKTHVR